MKKVIGFLSALFGIVLAGNAIYALYLKFHYDKRKKDYDVLVSCNHKKLDMSNENIVNKIGIILGSIQLDFTQCFQYDIPYELELTIFYGAAEIVVPKGWFVKTTGKITASGIENMTIFNEKENPEIRLTVNTQFAGVKITVE